MNFAGEVGTHELKLLKSVRNNENLVETMSFHWSSNMSRKFTLKGSIKV